MMLMLHQTTFGILTLAVSGVHGFVPVARFVPPPVVAVAPLPSRGPAIRMQEYQQPPPPIFTEKAYVRRGTLVWPHVHAAWMLISAVVDFCVRLGLPSARKQRVASPAAVPEPRPGRTHEPIFLAGTLCERVTDTEHGTEFCVCQSEVEHEDYACRMAAKDGKYVWYCTQRW